MVAGGSVGFLTDTGVCFATGRTRTQQRNGPLAWFPGDQDPGFDQSSSMSSVANPPLHSTRISLSSSPLSLSKSTRTSSGPHFSTVTVYPVFGTAPCSSTSSPVQLTVTDPPVAAKVYGPVVSMTTVVEVVEVVGVVEVVDVVDVEGAVPVAVVDVTVVGAVVG